MIVTFFGPPDPTFEAFDRFGNNLLDTGLRLNREKSTALLPSASPRYTSLCDSRNISYSSISIPALGTLLSRDRNTVSSWILNQSTTQHKMLFELLCHPLLPAQHAFS